MFLAIGVSCIPLYRYQINPDGICYLTISRSYLSGDWVNAVNSHWSPLFSWLLVPFLATGVDPLLAIKLLSLIIGGCCFIALACIVGRARLNNFLFAFILVSALPVCPWMSFGTSSPDFLLAVILLWYLYVLLHENYAASPALAGVSGILGGLAYLAKSFAFFFFLTHFVGHHLVLLLQQKAVKKQLLRNFLLGILCFTVIAGAWITIMALKYDRIAISTAANYNFALMASEGSQHPMVTQGLLDPPYASAVSVWEDPSTIPLTKWSPFESFSHFGRYIHILARNSVTLLSIFSDFSPFAVAILLVNLMVLLSPKILDASTRRRLLLLLLPFLIYVIGYAGIMVIDRYLWFVHLLLIVMLLPLFLLIHNTGLSKRAQVLLQIVLIASFSLKPTQNLIHGAGSGRLFYDIAAQLAQHEGLTHARIASNNHWHESLFIAFHLQSQYFGSTFGYETEQQVRQGLAAKQIDFYFFWGNRYSAEDRFLQSYSQVSLDGFDGLTIYDLRNDRARQVDLRQNLIGKQ